MTLRLGLLALLFAVSGCAWRLPAAANADAAPPRRNAVERFEHRLLTLTVDSDTLQHVPGRKAYVFTGNVVARQRTWVQHADRLEVVFNETQDAILRMEATGNVRVTTRDCLRATATHAVYHGPQQILFLRGDVYVSHWYSEIRFRQ